MLRYAWFCLLGLCGCDPATPCERAAAVDPSLTLGQGRESYEPVEEGGPFETESGPQGGQHVWGAMRATGLAPGRFNLVGVDEEAPEAILVIIDPRDGREVGRGQRSGVPWAGDEEESKGAGIQVFLEPDWPPAPALLLMQGEATDSCGTTVSAEQQVTLR